ncbi:hypothetical protein SA2016_1263 [Sinomonas atrocyanea]|uniref:DNA helicase n=1 Tax=Sinomonas atrocyanea TaxID=37927 RepID=A0A126ZXW5_9MICC|nr:AAA domain-containing protein [Sinomonas atrocyanea]AMM31943.1 hypothetical protein SA2016_1263 [Sinomonas atrocyanea]GEB65978.1 DNA helicase [Sinomonas atrocyanea]GGG65892.1 DNA helicase [Sinomonas atrocyanea]
MIDPRAEALLVWSTDRGDWQDKTAEVDSYHREGQHFLVRFVRGTRTYRYGPQKVLVLQHPSSMSLEGAWVEAAGRRVPDPRAAYRFDGPSGAWVRIFERRGETELHHLHPEHRVRIEEDVEQAGLAGHVLAYWRSIVAALPSGPQGPDPLKREYERLTTVHPDSVLARYLTAKPLEPAEHDAVPIAPFSSNLSQRAAVEKALRFPISVIEGPPGTGKTQTILNLIATLIASPGASVGVVASNNAAVENVRDKLAGRGIGYVVADLGRAEKRENFLKSQANRNHAIGEMLAESTDDPADPTKIRALAERLTTAQRAEWNLATLRQERDAYGLEREHFLEFLRSQDVVGGGPLPLLGRSSETLIDFLVEAALEGTRPKRFRWLRSIVRRLKYGSLGGAALGDTDLKLRVQAAFYDRRIAELDRDIADHERRVEDGGLAGMLADHRLLSERFLRSALRGRYGSRGRVQYSPDAIRAGFRAFTVDYPVILSTCHSLRRSIGQDNLLDCLIIDEASQADLLTSALAMASCRRIVVVGDQRQLPPIVGERPGAGEVPPAPSYDYRTHSIMSSLRQLYGDALPVTMLREHYRCDPAIIGFCNEKFYDGQLIPLTEGPRRPRPMMVVRTAEGNHMRQFRDGGRVNRREVDAIIDEVISTHCAGIPRAEIGITTPYRRQLTELQGRLGSAADLMDIEADTVHRYQGREKRAVIMSAVLDDTAAGRSGVKFVDDARLVNVAVSRARERFILVTDHRMLPTSRNLRDLMGYIQYQDPAQLVDSSIVSVFDLLYSSFSARLRPLAGRVAGHLGQRSEDIAWTVLHGMLGEEPYRGLKAVPQVLLRHLVPSRARLSADQAGFVRRGSSLDIVVYNRLTRAPVLAIEVDGFAFHDDNPVQLARDELKDRVLVAIGLPLLRLSTTGSGEEERIRNALDAALAGMHHGVR